MAPRAVLKAKEEVCCFRFWRAVRAEFLATLLLLFVGCGVALALPTADTDDLKVQGPDAAAVCVVAIGFGLAAAALTHCVGPVSGAHMNPAITLAMLAVGHVSWARAGCYALAQLLGGLSGSGILFGVARHRLNSSGLFVPLPRGGTQPAQAFGAEFMCTFVHAFAAFAANERRRAQPAAATAAVGAAVTAVHLLALQLSGAGLNPVRSLGPALITGQWQQHWLYWLGPALGAVAGGISYEYTQDSESELQHFRRSVRRRQTRSASNAEWTFTPSSTFENLRSTPT